MSGQNNFLETPEPLFDIWGKIIDMYISGSLDSSSALYRDEFVKPIKGNACTSADLIRRQPP